MLKDKKTMVTAGGLDDSEIIYIYIIIYQTRLNGGGA